MANLTSSWMDKAQSPGLYWDPRHHGLGVRVWKDGRTKSWVFQKSGGQRQTLGRWPSIEVNSARRFAAELNETPREMKRRSLKDVHDAWAKDHLLRGGSEVTVRENKGRVGKHAPKWWERDVSTLGKMDLIELRTDIVSRAGIHPARDTVNHIRRLVELATDTRIALPELKRPKSDRAERSADINTWWPNIEDDASEIMLDAHIVCALTGLRQSEVLKLRVDKIEGDRIFIPMPKSKMGEDLSFWRHVPTQVADILEKRGRFPLKTIRLNSGSYSHRLRHHYIGVAESETAVPRRVLRKLVNHTGKSDVTDGYGHVSDEACARWSQEIANLIAEKINL